MRCPVCEHENNSLATRCAKCGAMLHAPAAPQFQDTEPVPVVTPNSTAGQPPAAQAPSSTAERPRVAQTPTGTAEQPQPVPSAPSPTVDKAPQLSEVAGTAGRYVKSKRAQVGSFFRAHQRALGVAIALVVVGVLGVVWLVINLFDAPTYTQIEANIGERIPTFEYAGGAFGPDLTIPLSSVGVTERASTKTPEGLEVAGGVGPGAFSVEAEATYDDGKLRVVRNVNATYVRANNEWSIAGELAERGTSFTARAGVDEEKVLANVDQILIAASAGSDVSLSDIYAEGDFSIVGNVFREAANKDTATNDVTIHCERQSGLYAYEGNVIAHFAFESGSWALRSADADEGAFARTYGPLVGTWTGELSSTSSNGANCYAARDQQLVVSIDSIGDAGEGQGQVSGTVTVLAHFHERLDKDADAHDGDTVLERVSFTGVMHAGRDSAEGSNVTIACTTTGEPNSKLEFVLAFGSKNDPETVTARVTSSYVYEGTVFLFIPHQTTAQFIDTYTLNKS